MDIYTCNGAISTLKPEMYNLFRYVHSTNQQFKSRFPDVTAISHCNVIDIPPDIDVERLNIISGQVPSIECLEDQLPYVIQAKIITVHASSADEIVINNTNTKLIIVIGNVQNIRLIMDDPETIVYHRTFNYQDETGIIIGIEIDNLKPIYVQIKNSIAFPEVFSEVSQYGIATVTERNRETLSFGAGWRYIIDTKLTLNSFRDAGIVAFANNSTYEPEITKRTSIIYGKPDKFKGVNEIEIREQGDIIMADMSIDELKSFVEHKHIKSYETGDSSFPDGFTTFSDYNRGISPARHILVDKISDPTKLDELVFKIDNPFTFAYVKKRNSHTYQLLIYNVISNFEACGNTNDKDLMAEKLRIILASRRERELDKFREIRHNELENTFCPDQAFIREFPRVDPFASKRVDIRNSEERMESQTSIVNEFLKQKKTFVLNSPGNYVFENQYFLSVLIEAPNVQVFVKDCGLLFVSPGRSINVSGMKLHIIGSIHTIFCHPECEVVCYFVHHNTHGLFYTESETDDIGKFFDSYDEAFFHKQFRMTSNNNACSSETPNAQPLPRPNMTKVKNLHCNPTRIVGGSLAHIDRIIDIK